jgi:hypothetical protein
VWISTLSVWKSSEVSQRYGSIAQAFSSRRAAQSTIQAREDVQLGAP